DRRQDQPGFPPVAWVSLDEGDNDPLRFWSYIFAASQELQPAPVLLSPFQFIHEAAPFGSPPLQQWVNVFVNEITRLGCQGLLVLEDYHTIHEAQIHQLLMFLLDQLPSTLHLVLITRTDPPFSLARLRANHQLLEISASQLAFSNEETLHFLQQTLPFDLTKDVAAQIAEQMEGWVAGLRLFTLGFQGRTMPVDAQQVLSAFTGRHRYLLDYFLTEVLSAQPEHIQTFLLQTSILQRLNASLCDEVTGQTGSEHMLGEVEREGLFLQAIPQSEGWYRYHPLFAEAMQKEALQRLGEADVLLAQQRAQNWYERNDLPGEAIELALQRHAYSDMLVILERLLLRHPYAATDQVYAIQRWLQPVPEELLAGFPFLCFTYASALTFGSNSDQLDPPVFARVMALLQSAELQWQHQQEMSRLFNLYALRAMISARQGKIAQAARSARQALAIPSSEPSIWPVVCRSVLALESRRLGHFQEAYRAMLSELSMFIEMQQRDGSIILELFMGELCLEQGRLYKAEELFQTVLRSSSEESNDQARALIGMAQLAYERNLLVQARQQAQQAQAISVAINDGLLQTRAALILARIVAADGNVREAIKLLQARLAYLDPAQFLEPYRELVLWQMRLELSAGDVTSIQRWFDAPPTEEVQEVSRLQQEQEAMLQARWLLHNGEAQTVLTLLKPWREEALVNERLRSFMESGLLSSIAHHQLKQPQEARKQLGEILGSAHTEQYLRLFLDEGEVVSILLSAQLAFTRTKSLQEYIRAILQAFDNKPGLTIALADNAASLLASLSPQERQVLRLLVGGMERQEIAEHLVISLNTVKTHLQRLYQKLHVTNRFEAVEVARSLDLVD
ncbi:MAG TPA: LuxR C-terminal-related transcriptional regulator, partial [Ktedonobacteraceae bacterium]|nr:LuxR C-terminal-related transcriptional regulator [Ktedonobacteraceae bacterium]